MSRVIEVGSIDITPEAAEERHRKVTALLALINKCRVTPISAHARMEAMGELATSTWVTTIECAAQSGAPFWCDDVALRAAARSIGVAAFSTPALLDALVESEELTAEQRENVTRTFIEVLIGDFPIRSDAFVSAYGQISRSRLPNWCRIQSQCSMGQIRRRISDLVHARKSGCERRSKACLRLAVLCGAWSYSRSTRRQATQSTAAMLLSATVSYVSDYPDEVAKCVIATLDQGLAAVDRESAADNPSPHAVALLRASLANLVGITEATSYVSRAFSNLQVEDRQTVLHVLYAP